MMIVIKTVLSAVFSIFVIFIIAKIIGKNQISQMSIFEYVNGITLGSIGAELATSGFDDEWHIPLTALIVYGAVVFIISLITRKSVALRRFLDGKAMILYEDGKFFKKNMKKAHLDINLFLMECRVSGYFNIAEIQTAIHEANGKISVLPKTDARPPKNSEMNIAPPEEKPAASLILDGKILRDNLRYSGLDENKLRKEMKNQKIKSVSDVFYATSDNNGNISFYTQINEKPDRDIFM